MLSNKDFQNALGLINNANNVLITTHTRPDGDACGSMVALDHTLIGLGKKTTKLLLTELPEWYGFLFDTKPKVLDKDVTIKQLTKDSFSLIILVDVNSDNQLEGLGELLKQNNKPVLVIDHHVTNDGLGDLELIDASAAATALIIYELIKFAKWPVNNRTAEALFAAIATDTGWFKFSNTDSRVHQACAELINQGANPTQIYHDIYRNYSLERFKLMTAMLETLQLHLDGRYASQYLTQKDFKQTGATPKDTENLIDECQRINTVQVAALFVELPDGKIKCSLRSQTDINILKIAQKYGGGGHTTAAGTYLSSPLKKAMETILADITAEF